MEMFSSRRSAPWVVLVWGVVVCAMAAVASCEDLYRVLGVPRSASVREIRKAHKTLAKEWHPDKNKSPGAHEKMLEINKAYEILSDENRRRTYDLTGETSDSPQSRGPAPGQGFTLFQAGNTFHFRFNTGGPRQRGDGVTTNAFFSSILPGSHHKPYLLNFYHDFCMQCVDVERVWQDLKNEVEPLGVGLGSVHANFHPRIVHHCGVSRVPAVVGVVSGRVVHYQGRISARTIRDFLEAILPSWTVTELGAESDMELFLSKVIIRNRPRVVMFSPQAHPSLTIKLIALAKHTTADFGFVSTQPGVSTALLQRFGVTPGGKKLVVFKENQEPELSMKAAQITVESVRSLVEGLQLHLPRLSAPHVFNLICPVEATNRLCIVLLVEGSAAYNDSRTDTFRRLARRRIDIRHSTVKLMYIDTLKQATFVAKFDRPPTSLRACPDGTTATPVLVVRRVMTWRVQFDWFVDFCGLERDGEALRAFVSTTRLKLSAHLSELQDEEAPSFFGRILNKFLQFGYDVSDFVTAIDAQVITPLTSLLFAAILMCVVGAVAGPQEPPKDPLPARRTRERQTPDRASNGSAGVTLLRMDKTRYAEFVQNAPKGLLALTILVNGHKQEEAMQMIHAFWKIVGRYHGLKLQVFYVCYSTHKHWLEGILKHCEDMELEDVNARLAGCYGDKVATVLALIGTRRQLCVFPEIIKKDADRVRIGSVAEDDVQEKLSPDGPHVADGEHSVGGALGFDSEDTIEHSKSQNTASEKAKTKIHSRLDNRVEQISETFGMWMEKLADGSLRRYNVDDWPHWA